MGSFVSKYKTWIVGTAAVAALTALFFFKVPEPDKPVPPPAAERAVPDSSGGYFPGIEDKTDDTAESKVKLKVLNLTTSNTVELSGEVTYSSITTVVSKIKKLQQSPVDRIYLVISSPGGSVFSGMLLIETIQGSGVPIDTICAGVCASMGAQIHAVGSYRYMTDKSVLMFHPASGGFEGEFETMVSRMNFINRYINKMDSYVAQRAGIPYEEFKKRVRNEYWLDAQEATDGSFNDALVYLDDSRPDEVLSIFSAPEEQRSPSDKYFKGL